NIRHTTSGDMVDGLGAGIYFTIEDSAAAENLIAAVGAQRAGADNSGELYFNTYNAGTEGTRMTIDADGDLDVDSNTFFVDASANEVGLGTNDPNYDLDITSANADTTLAIDNTATDGDPRLNFQLSGSSNYSMGVNDGSTYDDFVIAASSTLTTSPVITIYGFDDSVGIGESTPVNMLEVTDTSSSPLAVNRLSTDGTLVNLKQANVVEGTISVSGTTVSYNAFTGSHYAWIDGSMERGTLVSMTGDNRHLHGNPVAELIYGIAASSVENDFRVLGSYLGLQETTEPASDENPHLVMAVGNGDVWLVDEGENVEVGDYLITSTTAGHARKDPGTHLASYIVARATEAIDWSMVTETASNGKKHKKIIVTFENLVRYNTGRFFSFRDTEPNEPANSAITMTMVTTGEDAYKLSLTDAVDDEIAYFGSEGDLGIKGKLYLSDRGAMQSSRYMYYDGSTGPGGDFIRTNAAGWATGSYDFAEMFPSEEDLLPGEIVMVDIENPGHVKRADDSAEMNGWLMAGIVSTRPGFLAGMNDAGSHPIALEGRVPTSVSAENGVIAVGDPITLSSVAGVGMKATEHGYVVGTALEAFDGSTSAGTIMVMLKMGFYNGSTVWDTNTDSSEGTLGGQVSGIIDMQGNPIVNIGGLQGIGGLWSIDSEGKLTAQAVETKDLQTETMTVKADDAKTTIGEGVMDIGNSIAVVENPAVRYNSRIFVTFFGNVGGNWWISERQDGRFVINLSAVADTDIPFEYWILDVKDDRTPVDPTAEEPPADEEPPVDEPPTDEPPADEEPPVDEPPADEPPVDEPPVDEPPTDEPPADEEPPVDEPPADEPPVDEPSADEPPVDEPPAGEPPAEEPPAEEPPVVDPPADDPPADPIDTGTTS
ncbi:MAG: hypothetical protein U9Q03_04420, partial [Patescibacteria group bacterium]|nr:hypothetical protein [Patescibacteria group bacterium]